MQMLIPIIAFLGIFVGVLLKKYIPEENKVGVKYRTWAERFMLIILGSYLLSQSFSADISSYISILIGVVLGTVLLQPYLFLGLALTSFDFVTASLTFIFGISYGRKKVIIPALLFFLPFLLLLTPIDTNLLLLTSAGASFAIAIKKNYNLL